MKRIEERYISLLTVFGFKSIFGTKPNKDLLINFLNSLLGFVPKIRLKPKSVSKLISRSSIRFISISY